MMPAMATDTTFNYDAAGKRTTVIDDGGTTAYTTNTLNQYKGPQTRYMAFGNPTGVGDVNYTYDESGNMTYDGANTYAYDPENRLVTATRCADPLAAACDNADLTFTTGGDGAKTSPGAMARGLLPLSPAPAAPLWRSSRGASPPSAGYRDSA
jgi:uncharacterized protein RhaS with RHS repeats